MLDRPSPAGQESIEQDGVGGPRWAFATMACSGVVGAAGVTVAAAGAHTSGGDLARTASEFLLVHATAILAGSGVALAVGGRSAILLAALGLLTVGAVLFGGELALAGLAEWRPVPMAAPVGGACLIAGWSTLAVSAVLLAFRAR